MDDVIYLLVSAEDGSEAEKLGAQWDPVQLRWFIRHDQDPGPFLGWLPIEELEEDETPELCVEPPLLVAETTVACGSCGVNSPVIGLMAERFSCGELDGATLLLGKATGAQIASGSSAATLGDYGGSPGEGQSSGEDDFGGDVFEDDEEEEFGGDDEEPEPGLMRFQHIESLPAEVVSFLGRHYPFFRKLTSPIGKRSYFVNFCACGEPYDDAYLHAEPGVGFHLFSREDARAVVLRELPAAPPLLLKANFGVLTPDVILKFSPRLPFPADS